MPQGARPTQRLNVFAVISPAPPFSATPPRPPAVALAEAIRVNRQHDEAAPGEEGRAGRFRRALGLKPFFLADVVVAAQGIVSPDYFVFDELKNEKKGVQTLWLKVVKNMKPGVTEWYLHAGLPNEALKAILAS